MGRGEVVEGKCHICGFVGRMSFEHVPPKAAFNDHPVWVLQGDAAIRADPANLPRGKQQQKGAGAYTLCESCNSRTGAWYGKAFADFTSQALTILHATRGRASLHYPFYTFPLKVMKQIVCMFMSVNSADFADTRQDLVRFVLNKRLVGLPSEYRIYIYYNAGGRGRSIAVSATASMPSSSIRVLSEITFPPLGYVLLLSGSPPDRRLVDITLFSRFLYGDYTTVTLPLPVIDIFTSLPGDYRDEESVMRDFAKNRGVGHLGDKI